MIIIVMSLTYVHDMAKSFRYLLTSCDVHLTSSGMKKGFLFKKKKVDNVWQSRFFVLDRDTIRYFKKIGVSRLSIVTYFSSRFLPCENCAKLSLLKLSRKSYSLTPTLGC